MVDNQRAENSMNEGSNWEEALLSKDFINLPNELNKKCSEDEFHKMMTSQNSDIPISSVNFLDYPD
jgi:hypothetical protein